MTSMNVIIFSHPCRKESGIWFGLLLVQEVVEAVELRLLVAVNVVPPVAHEVLLVEDGSIGTQESGGFPTGAAHVEGLTLSLSICVDSRSILTGTVEASVRNTVEHWIVHSSFSRDGSHLQTSQHLFQRQANSFWRQGW